MIEFVSNSRFGVSPKEIDKSNWHRSKTSGRSICIGSTRAGFGGIAGRGAASCSNKERMMNRKTDKTKRNYWTISHDWRMLLRSLPAK